MKYKYPLKKNREAGRRYRNTQKGRVTCEVKRKERQKTIKAKYNNYKSNAKVRFILWDLTEEEFIAFWQLPCTYCGDNIETIGLDRVDNQEGYNMSNVIPCCTRCNRMKSDMGCREFIDHCRKIICNKNL